MDVNPLKIVELLEPLNQQEVELVAAVAKERCVPKGSMIVTADEPGPTVFFLLRGEAKVAVTGNDGKEFLITLLEEGELFGELSVLTGEERSANVSALTDCTLASIGREDFLALLDQIPALSRSLLKILAFRLRSSSNKLGELALLDVTERVKNTLHSLAVVEGEKRLVSRRPTHQMLAAMVGTSREMVTRALSLLEETGEIRSEGRVTYLIS
jgi:CRP/FNR family transcriptional regulator, cyclic AMP receptor protein